MRQFDVDLAEHEIPPGLFPPVVQAVSRAATIAANLVTGRRNAQVIRSMLVQKERGGLTELTTILLAW